MTNLTQFYQNALDQSKQNYGNVLSAYGQGQSNLRSSLPGIIGGYDSLNQNQTQLANQREALGHQSITDQATQNRSQVYQQLARSGLTNSTITGNLYNQQSYQTQQALGNLSSNIYSGLADRYQQTGLARQAAAMQGLGLQTNLYGQQGGALAGYHFPLPNLGGGGGGGGGFGTGGHGTSYSPSSQVQFGRDAAAFNPSANAFSGNAGGTYLGGYYGYGGPGGNIPGQTMPMDFRDYSGQFSYDPRNDPAMFGSLPDEGGDYGGGGDF